jgi:hypothetical protein
MKWRTARDRLPIGESFPCNFSAGGLRLRRFFGTRRMALCRKWAPGNLSAKASLPTSDWFPPRRSALEAVERSREQSRRVIDPEPTPLSAGDGCGPWWKAGACPCSNAVPTCVPARIDPTLLRPSGPRVGVPERASPRSRRDTPSGPSETRRVLKPLSPLPPHAYRSHRQSSLSVGFLPYMRIPIR